MRKPVLLMILLYFSFAATWPADAGELAGVSMEERIEVANKPLVLNGMGLRKKAIFKVYVAGLYLPTKESDPQKILAADTSRSLHMEFLRTVGRDSLVGAWNDCLKANSPGAPAAVGKAFDQLNGMMGSVKTGDRLSITYSPANGTSVEMGGATKGKIAGKPFADAIFACWLGKTPPNADLKAGLLGK